MSKKTDLVARLLEEVKLRDPLPSGPKEGLSLLEHGAVVVLMRHMTQRQAEASVESLRATLGDWNEARVSQLQEISAALKTGSRKKGLELQRELAPAARVLKDYLQDVFQQTHGLDLEFLREDVPAGGKTMAELSVLGLTGGSYLLWIANDGRVPVNTALIRLLDRLGLMTRTTSMRKAQEAVDSLVPGGRERDFTVVFHEIADRWNDPREPIYMSVPALRECPFGRKAFKEHVAQEKREEERRRKEGVRRAAQEKREEERRRREEERARKREEAEARRREREEERRRKALERQRATERRKMEAARQKAATQKKAEAARKKAAAKKAASKKAASKKAAGKKKATAKKGARKTSKKAVSKTAKKTASKTASKTAKKKPTKKPAGRKTAKKTASKSKAGQRKSGRKKVTRRR